MPTEGTSFVKTGFIDQLGGDALPTGAAATLARVRQLPIESDSELIQGEDINRGVATAAEVDTENSSGTVEWESGPDENAATYWPIASVMRAPSLSAPAAVTFVGSYQIEDAVTLSNGETGARIVDVAGTDFASMYGETGFLIRVSGATDPANNRYLAVRRAFDNGGNSTLEISPGYTSGLAPVGTPLTFYGPPMVDVTEAITVQVGRRTVQGTSGLGLSRKLSLVQEWAQGPTSRFSYAENVVLGDLTVTVAPGSNIMNNVSFTGGKTGANKQTADWLPPAGDYDNGAILVNGAVAAGATTMDMDAGLAAGTIIVGDRFTVAGATGVYTFLAAATATAGAITGAIFQPAAPAGGFTNDVAVTIVHGAPFTTSTLPPASKATSRGDGNPGGLKIVGLVTRIGNEAVLLTCQGYGGMTGAELSLPSNNQPQDGTTCRSTKNVTPGTIRPVLTVDLDLMEDAAADRPRILGELGRDGTKEKTEADVLWEFPFSNSSATVPAAVGWHGSNAQANAFGFTAGENDSVGTGTMALTFGEGQNAEGELSGSIETVYFDEL